MALVPYLVSSSIDGDPGVPAAHRVDPLRVDACPFLDMLQRLDAVVRGPKGMALPRWAFFDCAEVPGLIAGFACPADGLPARARDVMAVRPGWSGPVPVSLVAAIPMLEPGSWHVYGLSCLDEPGPGSGSLGLGASTLELALRASRATRAYAATQWRDRELEVIARFAPLELLTAWTPAHSDPATLTCRFEISAARLEAARLGAGEGSARDDSGRWIDADDPSAQRDLQAMLEDGRRFHIVGPPRPEGGRRRVPVREVRSP
jgi:hypothetical protein